MSQNGAYSRFAARMLTPCHVEMLRAGALQILTKVDLRQMLLDQRQHSFRAPHYKLDHAYRSVAMPRQTKFRDKQGTLVRASTG